MITAGIDIGSRTIKFVIVSKNKIIHSEIVDNSFNTIEICKQLIEGKQYDKITATGYGRHLFTEYFTADVISEIKAFSIGVKYFFPQAKTILDIGGQDTKAISLDNNGKLMKFEMNDKCAAGTGRFIEIMSMALRFNLNDFGAAALSVSEHEKISSMCTVFAESEVVSMLGRGYDRNKIARGIHLSIVNRSIMMLKKVGLMDDLVFVGGVAKNIAMKSLLETSLQMPVLSYEEPQIIGALGCALLNNGKNNA